MKRTAAITIGVVACAVAVYLAVNSRPSATSHIPPVPGDVQPEGDLYAPGDHYVDHVVDGDTVWLRKDGQTIKVRLLRVDAPELHEPGYAEATEELSRQLGDESSIRLEFEGERKDEHGRTLAYLFIDGKNVNLAMVRSGWSPFFRRYGAGRYAEEFRRAESDAKRERIGLWSNR